MSDNAPSGMPGPRRISLVIADDHVMVVEAMRLLLERSPNLDVVSVAKDGDGLLAAIDAQSPDIALVDVSMPGPGAEAIAKELAMRGSRCRLIALTMHLEPHLAQTLLDAGFAGYVIKDSAVQDLFAAIETVMSGETYLSDEVAALAERANLDQSLLTTREQECLRAAAQGLSNKAIAAEFNISVRTVKYHLENVSRKLNTTNRSEATAVGRKLGLL